MVCVSVEPACGSAPVESKPSSVGSTHGLLILQASDGAFRGTGIWKPSPPKGFLRVLDRVLVFCGETRSQY